MALSTCLTWYALAFPLWVIAQNHVEFNVNCKMGNVKWKIKEFLTFYLGQAILLLISHFKIYSFHFTFLLKTPLDFEQVPLWFWILTRGFPCHGVKVYSVTASTLPSLPKVKITNLTQLIEPNIFGIALYPCKHIFNLDHVYIVSLLISLSRVFWLNNLSKMGQST